MLVKSVENLCEAARNYTLGDSEDDDGVGKYHSQLWRRQGCYWVLKTKESLLHENNEDFVLG
jgi:hypothetical protein